MIIAGFFSPLLLAGEVPGVRVILSKIKNNLSAILLICLVCFSYSVESQAIKPNDKRVVRINPDFERAQELEAQGKYEEAKEIYKHLYESGGTDNAFWKLLLLYEKTDDFKEMERFVLERLKKTPDDISMRRYLARAYYGQGDKKKGKRTLLKIIGGNFNDLGRVYVVTNEFTRQNDLDTAIEIYLKARKKAGRPGLFSRETARIHSLRMNYIKAIEEYIKSLENVKVNYASIEKMIQKARETGEKTENIVRPLEEYLESHPKSILAARLLSDLMYDTGDYESAYKVLVPAAVASENPQDVWDLAERFKSDGHADEALRVFADYYRFFENDSKRVSSLLEMASIKVIRGDKSGAQEDYRRLARDYKGTLEGDTAVLRTIKLAGDTMDIDKFTQSLVDFGSTTKFRTLAREACLLRYEAFLRAGRPEESKQAVEEARIKSRSRKEKYEVAAQAVMLNFFTGDYEAMSREIEICIGNFPGGARVNDLLSLKILAMRCSTEPELQDFNAYSKGKYALYREDMNAAVESLLSAAQDTSSVVAPFAAIELAKMFLELNAPDKAVTWYLHAAETARDAAVHTGALMGAADILAVNLDNKERAAVLYLDALTSEPGNVHESEIRRKLKKIVEE